ncbi:MAG: hypothetical protein O7D96_03030 [SAR324 cluster bacterium]|nr:hypothetical protein [SAR324 cluster bacterium]
MSTTRKELIYHGAGFPVRLVNFPCYEDEDGYGPEYPIKFIFIQFSIP